MYTAVKLKYPTRLSVFAATKSVRFSRENVLVFVGKLYQKPTCYTVVFYANYS